MGNKMKRTFVCGLACAMLTGIFSGNMLVSAEEAALEFETYWTGDQLEGLRVVLENFTAESGIKVDLVSAGSDYESVMKTRMASGDMPDIFETHGWSIARYKDYLTVLTGAEWEDRIAQDLLPVITDDNGDFYVLPVTKSANGIVYNKQVLADAGVDAASILTMDDFMEACEKIKAIGVTPIHVGGKDAGQFAGIYNGLAPSYFCTDGCRYPYGAELKDGTFDWDAYGNGVISEIAEMIQKGYFNEDYFTAEDAASIEALGTGKTAFGIRGCAAILNVTNIAPDAEIGFIPVPATGEGKATVQVGENTCYGIWNGTEYMEEAKQLLDYLSRPENAIAIMDLDGAMPAMDGMEEGATVTYEEYNAGLALYEEGSIHFDNIYDREYLPSGMWSILMDAMAEVFMDPTETGVEAARELLKENFVEKFAAAE